ncbi:MAG: transcriptional repressor [Desulfuromonadaceae bacterium]|nr:transcriptional repressor [Desulfuromonadaceae bacterium]
MATSERERPDCAVPQNKKQSDDKIARFESALKAAGLKLTYQRLEIFRELANAADHPTVEILHQRLKNRIPTLSLDTIYRTLATLEQHGLITRVQTAESQAHFELTIPHHHHLICEKCGRITDFDWPAFDNAPLPEKVSSWGKVFHRKAILHGRCLVCQSVLT